MVAPLLTAHDASGHVHLIVGSNPLANARCTKSLEVGAKPVLVAKGRENIHYALCNKIDEGLIKWLDKDIDDEDLRTLGREDVEYVVDAVFVTGSSKSPMSSRIAALCRRLRIPVNIVDSRNLSSFTLLSTHSDGPLQIGITTSGNGCKLASRVRREIASSLPPNFGTAVERLGTIRRRMLEEDRKAHDSADLGPENSDDDAVAQKSSFNKLVTESDPDAAKTRRIRWLSQICEYWPIKRLASISDADIEAVLDSYKTVASSDNPNTMSGTRGLKAQIILAGSGPGSPELLTVATRNAIETASVILTDKLVPSAILDLIPRRTPVHIARKFPGNADAAQEELLDLGLEALKKGQSVLRLKQGDPYLYGRGGEEYKFFESHGYTPRVLPGVTSALSGPLFAAIPPTHRGIADQVLISTGTGRKGAALPPPPYVRSQTVVFLMALHRLSYLVNSLTGCSDKTEEQAVPESESNPSPWPVSTPCAVVERASCPDQRVIRSTLQHVVAAVEEEGSRPPGLLIIGTACEVLKNPGGNKWVVEEGMAQISETSESAEDLISLMAQGMAR